MDALTDPVTLLTGGANLSTQAAVEGSEYAVGEITGANDLEEQQAQMLAEQQRSNQQLEAALREEQERQRLEVETAEANASRRRRRREETAGRTGRTSTILTSPLGVTDTPAAEQRTLLGA